MEIVKPNTEFLHDTEGDLVVPELVVFHPARTGIRDRRGRRPNQRRSGLLQAGDDLTEVGFVFRKEGNLLAFVGGNVGAFGVQILQVMKAEIEVNHVPFGISEPFVEILHTKGGLGRIFERAENIGFAFEEFANRNCVAVWRQLLLQVSDNYF